MRIDDELGPIVAVMPRHGTALVNLENIEAEMNPPPGTGRAPVTMARCVLPSEAFSEHWHEIDAHFVTYMVTDNEGKPEPYWPRFKKKGSPALAQIRQHGGDIKSWAMAFDCDSQMLCGEKVSINAQNKEHVVGKFWDLVLAAPQLAWVTKFTYYYTTKRGVRLLFVLKNPLSVDRMEGLHKHLVKQLHAYKVPVDPLSDWTRLFRLPRVTRRDEGTEELCGPGAFEFEEVWQEDERFDAAAIIGQAALLPPIIEAEVPDYPRPERSDLPTLIGKEGARPKWWAKVEIALRPKGCYTTVYKHRPISAEGTRMLTVGRYAGEVTKALAKADPGGESMLGPSHAYALLHEGVEQLEPDEETPDWLAELWDRCRKFWANDQRDKQQKRVDRETAQISVMSTQDNIIKGMRSWDDAPELKGDDQTAMAYLESKLIALTPAGLHYLMTPNGYYDSIGLKERAVIPRIREIGMQGVIPTGFEDEKGKWKTYTTVQLLNRHATVVKDIEGHGAGPGNYIQNISGESPRLILRLYRRRTDLQATYDPEVDEWLRVVHASEKDPGQVERAMAGIGHALAFDEGPMAAQAWIGSRSIGKKMIAEGFAECLDTGIVADTSDMDKFNELLWASPFIVVNEGLPTKSTGMDPADQFRRLTAGDRISLEKKFHDRVVLRAALRMLIFANNAEVLTRLAGRNRNLTEDDKMALAQRLVVYKINPRAQHWLRQRGGYQHTSGWIGGDAEGGASSDFRVAKHFLWLYENRPAVQKGNRFLIEGNMEDELVHGLSTRSGNAPMVIEILVAMIERVAGGAKLQGCSFDEAGSNVYVTGYGISSFQRNMDIKSYKQIPERETLKVLQGLLPRGETGSEVMVREDRDGPKTASWWRLDLQVLLQEAYDLGYPCSHLERMVKNRNANKVIKLGGA